MHVGIDLGTTYSCIAYVDDDGQPKVIPSSDNEQATPSVIWCDGRQAYVGQKANQRKLLGLNIYEFVKRDIGKPVTIPPNFYETGDSLQQEPAPYEIDGFRYGAAGMSAVILRKLKKEAIQHFKRIGKLDKQIDERNFDLDAVITVPAYFGDRERQDTKLAGYAAGLNVIAMINEPTAAALSYGLVQPQSQKNMVFDLGGGTCDVTILNMKNGEAEALASEGHNSLGGREWDDLIKAYLYGAFSVKNGRDIPLDPQRGYEMQQLALRAKLELSEQPETRVFLSIEEGELDVSLYRSAPEKLKYDFDMDAQGDLFYFDLRASELLYQCQVLCESALRQARVPTPGGGDRGLDWRDLDEIVLAGGACRMPMIPAMLERISGRKIRQHVKGFDYDTAIAIGAALHGQHRGRVRDVTSRGIGIKVMQDDRYFIENLIAKNSPLPTKPPVERRYRAGSNAILEVYEGESRHPDECVMRGRIELNNPDGHVTVSLEADTSGILTVSADYPPYPKQVMELKSELYMYDERAQPLRQKIQALHLNM